jgi:hypothetical protein
MKRLRQTALFVPVLLASFAISGVGWAQGANDVARAEALFSEATKLMDAGDYTDACPKLASSQHLVRGIGVTLYLGECYERTGKTASAWAQFRLAESLANSRGDKRAAVARDRADSLEAQLPRLKIVVPPANRVQGLEVLRDGSVLEQPEWGVEVPVDPGSHTVVARGISPPWQTTVNVPPGKSTVAVEVGHVAGASDLFIPPTPPPTRTAPSPAAPTPALPPASAPPPSAAATPSRDQPTEGAAGKKQRLIGLVTGGAGIVLLGAGAAFGLIAKSKFSDSDAYCTAPENGTCKQAGLDLRSSGMAAATVSTAAFIVGGVAVAGGTVIYLTAPKATSVTLAPTIGPRAAGLVMQGTWF